jgi:phosphate-selective porin OprO/OprP
MSMKSNHLRFAALLLICLIIIGSVARAQTDVQWDQTSRRTRSRGTSGDFQSSGADASEKKTKIGTTGEAATGSAAGKNANQPARDTNDDLESNGEDLESVEERLDEAVEDFEKQTKELSEEFEESIEALGERIDPIEVFADNDSIVFSGTSNSTLKVSGRIHNDYWSFPNLSNDDRANAIIFDDGDPLDRLGFRRLRFGVKGKIKDNMQYKIESEFAGGNRIEFRDAYLGFDELAFFQTVLIGNQKRPYGLDHLNSSRYNVFLERPFIIEAFNQDARRLGIAAYGVSENERFNWRYGVYNQQLVQALGNYVGDHYQLELAGRLANTIWYDEVSGGRGYAHWAISGTIADPSDDTFTDTEARFRSRPEARSSDRWLDTRDIAGADAYELLGLESVINIGRLQLAGEYQNVWMQRKLGSPSDNLRFYGGYVYVAYFLTGEHIPWDRRGGVLGRVKPHENFWLVDKCCGGIGKGLGAWQIAARYSHADLTDDDIFGGVGESLTVGLNWHWNPNARMQFNFLYGNIDDREDENGGLTSTDYSIFGTRFMVDF